MLPSPLSCAPPQPSATFDAGLSVADTGCGSAGRTLRQQVSSVARRQTLRQVRLLHSPPQA